MSKKKRSLFPPMPRSAAEQLEEQLKIVKEGTWMRGGPGRPGEACLVIRHPYPLDHQVTLIHENVYEVEIENGESTDYHGRAPGHYCYECDCPIGKCTCKGCWDCGTRVYDDSEYTLGKRAIRLLAKVVMKRATFAQMEIHPVKMSDPDEAISHLMSWNDRYANADEIPEVLAEALKLARKGSK